MTPSTGEVQIENHEDEEEQHVEIFDNLSELDMETLNYFEEWSTKANIVLERQGTKDPTVL